MKTLNLTTKRWYAVFKSDFGKFKVIFKARGSANALKQAKKMSKQYGALVAGPYLE